MQVIDERLYFTSDTLLSNLRLVPTLYNFLATRYDDTKDNVIEAPANIKKKHLYLRGFKLYYDSCSLQIDEHDLTEEILFYMAVVGYTWQNCIPLIKLCDYLNQISDKYYWLWLAKYEEFFKAIMNVELVRRGILTEDELEVIKTGFEFLYKFKEFPYPEGFISQEPQTIIRDSLHHSCDEENGDQRLHQLGDVYFSTCYSYIENKHVINNLLCYDNVIVSGTPLNYIAQPCIKLNDTHISQDGTMNIVLENARNKLDCQINYNLYQLNDFLYHDDETLTKIMTETADKVLLHNVRTPADFKHNIKAFIRKYYSDMVLELNNEFYFNTDCLDDQLVGFEVDVYFCDKATAIATMLLIIQDMVASDSSTVVYHTEHMTTLYNDVLEPLLLDRRTWNYKINLMKQCYSTPRQVLANIDLDSQRYVAYRHNKHGIKTLATPAYEMAMTYGINPIVPSRITKASNRRFLNLRVLGYEPWLPLDTTRIRFDTSVFATYSELATNYNKQVETLDYDLNDKEIKDGSDTAAIFELHKLDMLHKEKTEFYSQCEDDLLLERDQKINELLVSNFWSNRVNVDYLANISYKTTDPLLSFLTKTLRGVPRVLVDKIAEFFATTRKHLLQRVYNQMLRYYNQDLLDLRK